MWIRTQGDNLINSDHVKRLELRDNGRILSAIDANDMEEVLGCYETEEQGAKALHSLITLLTGITVYRPKGFGEGED